MDADLEIYEAVYVVAVPKQMSADRISQNPLVVEYINEMVLKLLSYPESSLFEEGEIDFVSLPGFEYRVDGKTYSDIIPDIYYTHRFTFRKNEEYPEFPSGIWVSNGKDAPEKYMEFYPIDILQPWVVADGSRFIYLNNRMFLGGFCDAGTRWDEIMEIVYRR